MKNKIDLKKRDVLKGIAVSSVALLTVPLASAAPTTLQDGSLASEWSYIIFLDNGKIKAKNGLTGKIDFEGVAGVDDTAVIQSALNTLPSSTSPTGVSGGKIFLKTGTYIVSNLVINKNGVTLEGESWGTILSTPNVGGTDTIRLEVSPTGDRLFNCSIKNLFINRNFRTGNGITNMHSTGFPTNNTQEISNFLIERVRFMGIHENGCAIQIRNPDNKFVVRFCWFQGVSGKDIYFESHGRAAGNLIIEYNGFHHGTPKGVIHIKTVAGNIRRANILYNTLHITQGNDTPAFLFENFSGGFLDHINIIGNSLEDPKIAIDVGGSGTSLVNNMNIRNNSFFYANKDASGNWIPPVSGQRMILLRSTASRVTIQGNLFENRSSGTGGVTGIEEYNTSMGYSPNYGKNKIVHNLFKSISSPVVPAQGQSLQAHISNNAGHLTENFGTATFTGDGIKTSFDIPHGLSNSPKHVSISPKNAASAIPFFWSADSTKITITYQNPPSGQVRFSWQAEL